MNSLVGVGGATAGPRRSPQPRASSPCVGRDEELRRLTAALTCAAEGRGAAVFLMGEPGVGKTRLAREALAVARACGFTVVEGRAFPNECGLAYAPVLDAFGPFLRKLDSDRLGRLVRGLADLGRLFSTLGLPAPEPVGDPGLEKTRLFEAMARFVERIAQETPVAIFIDDLQWADVATIDMLHYLGRGLGDQRVLLLASQPNDVFDSSPGLRAMRRSLERAKLGEEIVVPPLGQDAVEGLARSVLEGNAPENLLALLDTWAGGIPLFVEALLGALIDSANLVRRNGRWVLNAEGAPALPPDLRRLVLGCLERLAPIDRRILDLIASLGNPITHILEIASGMEEQALFNGLARLRSAGLVTEGVDGLEVTYRIALPLVQKVVCAELPEILRLRGRTVATEANESTTDGRRDDRKCPNTHHDGASPESKGDLAEAAPLAAGDLATLPSTYVPAMEADDSGSAPVHEGFDRDRSVAGSDKPVLPSSLEHLGEGWESFGEVDAAIAAWSEALTERERVGDAQSVYRLRRRLTIAEWNRGNFEIADLHHKAAIAALASRESLTESTELRFERFRILLSLGDAAGLADMVAEFQSLAQQLASPQAQAEANLATSNFRLWQGDIANARELALNAAIAGEQTQDPVICSRAYTTLVVIGMRLGDHNFMRFHDERGLSVAQRLGAPYSECGVLQRFHLPSAKFMFGD
ncbi:MAG: AAA family ATPase, partial [Chloroflexi bacterium]|nr:AAA family ATPase [Chloroflexota bacterium]